MIFLQIYKESKQNSFLWPHSNCCGHTQIVLKDFGELKLHIIEDQAFIYSMRSNTLQKLKCKLKVITKH